MGKLDTRILSLYSRDSQREKFIELGEGQYYTFCYYDAIEVVKTECDCEGACHSLLSAYEAAARDERRLYASRQFLLAFADIREEGLAPSRGCCYEQKDIEAFWKEDGKPLFFVTMVNLRDNCCLDKALEAIDNIFKGEQYLTYLTFDHCSLLLFCRSGGFSAYADKIFQLNYGTNLVEDSITLCSFNERASVESGERFGVYLRFGIQDYAEADRFVKDYKKQGANVGRLLGRNDIGLFKEDADIPWLQELIGRIREFPKQWYTTFELSVLIQIPEEESSWTVAPKDIQGSDSGIKGVMKNALDKFLDAYKNGSASMAEDPVWTHWLSKASSLAVSLYDNQLAMDFGTCLVPQFLDLFTYAGRLLNKKVLSGTNKENVREIFSTFFSSTSILMDSINHSSRKFVQVPSFGSVSFEMPPKLMAYYTAVTHEFIEAFRDEDCDYTYGVAFCPEFVCTLKVSSYADQRLSKDEWLTISVGERSLYTLQQTTETLGHEISHFVGEHNRCRDVREIEALRAGLTDLAGRVLRDIGMELAKYCRDPDLRATTRWTKMYDLANRLMEGLKKSDLLGWSKEEEIYSRILRIRLANLPEAIRCVPDLTNTLTEWLCELLLNEEGTAMPLLAERFAREIGGSEAKPREASQPVYRAMARDYIYERLLQKLEDLADFNRKIETGEKSPMYDNGANGSSPDWICYMFSESFADLQMILLFNLSWEDYRALLMPDESQLSAADCPPRMLVVAKALVSMGKWQVESVQTTKYAEVDKSFGFIGEAVSLDLFPDNSRRAADRAAARLQDMGFEPSFIFYLSEYLKACGQEIEKSLQREEKTELVKELRGMHDLLSRRPPVYELEMGLIDFIDYYRSNLSRK